MEEIDIYRKYGIDGQLIDFVPKLLEIGDQITQDGVVLQCVEEGKFVLVTQRPSQEFVPADKLLKRWRIM